MSQGGGFRRQGGLVEVETDTGVKGIGEAFDNPFVTQEYFRMVEPFFVGSSVSISSISRPGSEARIFGVLLTSVAL
ncbi:MAG: hypothetical protein JSR91_10930 [Proteobacteria bacterium]|nr:hypothetical protein [Pseudomonadota bacterium]